MRVLDEDGKAILGLYAAGLESQANIFSGGACDDIINYGFLNWAVFSGYAAGRYAAGDSLRW